MTTMPDQALSLAQEPRSISFEEQRATLRERLQRRFEVWLDEALNPEAIPQGLAVDILDQLEAQAPDEAFGPAGEEDLQSVCAALVGLTETGRHQGVALEQLQQDLPAMHALAETVSTLMDSLAADREAQAQARQQLEEKQRLEARRQVFNEVLGTVIDMRDRLCVGLNEAQGQLATLAVATAPKKRWLQPAAKKQGSLSTTPGHTGLEALVKANQLAITGIDQALTGWHVALVEGVGQPVNTETMKVVDQGVSGELAEGTVLKVLRAGFKWDGTLCRPAEVCVVQSTATE
jgi:hypothetical protein